MRSSSASRTRCNESRTKSRTDVVDAGSSSIVVSVIVVVVVLSPVLVSAAVVAAAPPSSSFSSPADVGVATVDLVVVRLDAAIRNSASVGMTVRRYACQSISLLENKAKPSIKYATALYSK